MNWMVCAECGNLAGGMNGGICFMCEAEIEGWRDLELLVQNFADDYWAELRAQDDGCPL